MKYNVHAGLVSFYAMALALFQEVIEGAPNYARGGGVATNNELINIADTAALFGRIAFHDAASVEERKRIDDSLSPVVRSAYVPLYGVPAKLQFSDCYPHFEVCGLIDPLETDPTLFGSEARMRSVGFSILLHRDDSAQALLGLLLLVASTVLAIRDGRISPDDVSYSQAASTVRYFHGYVKGEALKALVYGMAHAVVARVQLP